MADCCAAPCCKGMIDRSTTFTATLHFPGAPYDGAQVKLNCVTPPSSPPDTDCLDWQGSIMGGTVSVEIHCDDVMDSWDGTWVGITQPFNHPGDCCEIEFHPHYFLPPDGPTVSADIVKG